MYFFRYKLTGYEQSVGGYTHEGLVYGENFTEAVDNLENYYGNEIEDLYLQYEGEADQPYVLNEQYKINEEE